MGHWAFHVLSIFHNDGHFENVLIYFVTLIKVKGSCMSRITLIQGIMSCTFPFSEAKRIIAWMHAFWTTYNISGDFNGNLPLKGLSHQFESGYKWYGWKKQK